MKYLTYCKILGSCPPSLNLPHPATVPISPGDRKNGFIEKKWIFEA